MINHLAGGGSVHISPRSKKHSDLKRTLVFMMISNSTYSRSRSQIKIFNYFIGYVNRPSRMIIERLITNLKICSGMDTEYSINIKGESKENMPLPILLCEWALNNFSVPRDLSVAAIYVLLFTIAWYGVSLVARLIVAVLWPLILLASAVVVLRAVQFYESEQAYAVLHTVVKVVANILVALIVIAKCFVSFIRLFDSLRLLNDLLLLKCGLMEIGAKQNSKA
ncbi:hypothetical protein GQX74_010289 [Glossina fuscipes]|nr:hypothetical protein GQX74_010289 [Glossina fuscipes]